VVAFVAVIFLVACSKSQQRQPPTPAPTHSADLQPFLESYFATWSVGDMEAYRGHFHSTARIHLLKSGSIQMALDRDPFVEGQRAIREASDDPGVERMTDFRVDEDRQAATVTAEWELRSGGRLQVGIDRFTLIRDEQWNWKIVGLLFYGTERGRPVPAE
jgi:hypothetical protein